MVGTLKLRMAFLFHRYVTNNSTQSSVESENVDSPLFFPIDFVLVIYRYKVLQNFCTFKYQIKQPFEWSMNNHEQPSYETVSRGNYLAVSHNVTDFTINSTRLINLVLSMLFSVKFQNANEEIGCIGWSLSNLIFVKKTPFISFCLCNQVTMWSHKYVPVRLQLNIVQAEAKTKSRIPNCPLEFIQIQYINMLSVSLPIYISLCRTISETTLCFFCGPFNEVFPYSLGNMQLEAWRGMLVVQE